MEVSTMSDVIESAIARLQLPIQSGLGERELLVIRESMPDGLDDDAIALEIDRLNIEWVRTGMCPIELKRLIEILLLTGLPPE